MSYEKEFLTNLSMFNSFPMEDQPNTIQSLTASRLLRIVKETKTEYFNIKLYIIDDFYKYNKYKKMIDNIDITKLTIEENINKDSYLYKIYKKYHNDDTISSLPNCIIYKNHLFFVKASKEFESDQNTYLFITNGIYAIKILSINKNINITRYLNYLSAKVDKILYNDNVNYLKQFGLDIISSLDTDLPSYTYDYRRMSNHTDIITIYTDGHDIDITSTILSSIDMDIIDDIDVYNKSLDLLLTKFDHNNLIDFLYTVYDDLKQNKKENQGKRKSIDKYLMSYVEERIEKQITIMIETEINTHMKIILIPYINNNYDLFLHIIKALKKKFDIE